MLQMGIQPEGKRKNDTGESVFPETDPISLFFRFAYILFIIHRDEYRVTWGSADLTLSKSGASYKCIQKSHGFYIIFWPCMALSDNDQSTRKLIFSRDDFFS